MNPFAWPFRAQFLFGFACCAALLGYALFVQFQLGIQPCPFCIFQRICFAVLGLVFLLGGLHAPRSTAGRKVWGIAALLAASVGVGYAGRHSWVQLYPPPMPSCGPGLNFIVEQYSWLGAAKRVLQATGDCSNIDWQFLGLSMPMWALLWFAGLGLGGLYAGFKARHVYLFRK